MSEIRRCGFVAGQIGEAEKKREFVVGIEMVLRWLLERG